MKNIILVIYGLPGVGKTTFIHEFTKQYPLYQYIPIDDIWEKCFIYPSYTLKESEVVFAALTNEIKTVLIAKKPLIVEGVFASENRLQEIRKLAHDFDYTVKAVLLKASHDVIKNRVQSRKVKRIFSSQNWNMLKKKMNRTETADIILNTEMSSPEKLVKEMEMELAHYE